MKKYLIIGLIFIIVFLVILFVTKKQGGRPKTPAPITTPSPTPAPPSYRGVNLETGSGNDIIKILGAPLRSNNYNGVTTLIYASSEVNREIGVQINQDNTIRRIIEPASSSLKFSVVASGLGAPDMILYGKNERLGFALYVYLSQGTALLTNPTTQQVQERWYFPIMSSLKFTNTIGTGFTAVHEPNKP